MKRRKLKKWVENTLYFLLMISLLISSIDFQNTLVFVFSKIFGVLNVFLITLTLKLGGNI